MFFVAASLALLSAALVVAEDHTITVGGPGKLLYDPEAIFAAPGDVVHFVFKQKNHTVTQGSFAKPCDALLGNDQKPVFDSGFHFVADTQTDGFDTLDYVVKDTKPVWMHCSQTGHCGKGMVFAINCGADGAANSFTNFKASALAIGAAASGSTPAPASTVIGGVTVAPEPTPAVVTVPVTVSSSVWTTTYSSYPGSPDPTPVSLVGETHVVKVGANGLSYDPSTLTVKPRDKIQFVFYAKNHTVTQSSFAQPCSPLSTTSQTGQVGFDSGFQFVAAGTAQAQLPTYEITVNSTDPIWAYCKQANHCGSGMVFAANVDNSSTRNFAAFASIAKNINGTGSANSTTGSNASSPYGGAAQLGTGGLLGAIGTLLALFL